MLESIQDSKVGLIYAFLITFNENLVGILERN
jgi:hypothetical protein